MELETCPSHAEIISDAVKGLDIEDVSANVIKAKFKDK